MKYYTQFLPAKFVVANRRTRAFTEKESIMCKRNTLVLFHFVWGKIVRFLLMGNSHRFFHTNGKRPFFSRMEWSDDTEAQNFTMDTARFLDVFKEGTSKMKQKCSCSDNHLSNYTKTIILLRLSEYYRIIPSTSSQGLFDNIHLAFGE